MNKRALTILLVVLAIVAAIWVLNLYAPQQAATQEQAQQTSSLVSLDGTQKSDDASATAAVTATPADTAQSLPQATAAAIDAEGYLHLLSAADGRTLARVELDSAAASAPLVANQLLYVTTRKGTLYALRAN